MKPELQPQKDSALGMNDKYEIKRYFIINRNNYIITVYLLVLITTILFWTEGFNPPAKDIILEGKLRNECFEWNIISVYEYDLNNYANNDYPELQKRYPKTEEGVKMAKKFCVGLE
ncbi:MAG: hypothetical protein KAT28_03255 [Candidatus Aenigmarchaeota archaeon]|nr:hypothetical protein [Candidatus Aenigmarchaeota archaeon]